MSDIHLCICPQCPNANACIHQRRRGSRPPPPAAPRALPPRAPHEAHGHLHDSHTDTSRDADWRARYEAGETVVVIAKTSNRCASSVTHGIKRAGGTMRAKGPPKGHAPYGATATDAGATP
jgi:hypothetical protein